MDGDDVTLEQLAQLAALVCGTPIGGVRLIGDADAPAWWWTQVALTPAQLKRAVGLGERLLGDELVVVPDLGPAPEHEGLRFVAGARLRDGAGRPVAQLLVLDRVAHLLDAQQRLALGLVARQVAQALARRGTAAAPPPPPSPPPLDFADFVEHAPVGMHSVDADSRCRYMNAVERGWLGYTREETEARLQSFHLASAADVVHVRDTLLNASAGDRFTFDVDLRRRDGSTFPVTMYTNIVVDDDGVRRATRSVVVERRPTAPATTTAPPPLLQRDPAPQLISFLEGTSDAFLALDRDGVITYLNNRAAALSNRSAVELIGQRLWTAMPQLVGGPLHQQIEQVQREGVARQFEVFGPVFQRWFETRVYPTAGGGVAVFSLDVTDRHAVAEAERVATTQLRALSERLISVREEEAARLAREIHDGLGQPLTALKLDLSWLGSHSRGDPGDLHAKLPGMLTLVDEMFATIRRMSAELRPSLIDDLGLAAAADWLVGEFARRAGVAATIELPDDDPPLARTTALGLYRILQEALSNVARHAAARNVAVRLRFADAVTLEIEDDGRGIRPEERTSPTSIGLVGMRERAALIGGELEIGPAPDGRGTLVRVRAPRERAG